jgi:FixJ family two-component response regulator
MTDIKSPERPVLLVDDEEQALTSFELALRSVNLNHFIRCLDSREVIPLLAEREVEIILLDLRMPHLAGDELLPLITSDFPEVPVIVITGANDVETAVRCMKLGAFDYMVKPVERSRLIGGVKRAVEFRDLQRENRLLKAQVLSDKLEHPDAFSEIVTGSARMRSIFQYIEAIARSPRPLLITGETGVGKELVARAAHRLSRRRGAFVPVNVAGLDDNVFADTLFGHKKGAFTGAEQARGGLLEQAAGGRDRGLEPSLPGQAPAAAAGRRILAPGVGSGQTVGCPHHRGHQPGFSCAPGRRCFSQGPLLPALRSSSAPSPAPGASGRPPPAAPPFSGKGRGRTRQEKAHGAE